MHTLLEYVRRIFQFGRGRPAALVILLWTVSLSVVSELPLEGGTADLTGSVTGAFTKARQFLFDGYQKNYPREPQSQPVTIVAIDELSLSKLGQWPWPRTQLAALRSWPGYVYARGGSNIARYYRRKIAFNSI